MNEASGILTILLFGMVYFLPSFIAACRGHHNAGAIFALNLLLGWTFIGWVMAVVWALTAVVAGGKDARTCPYCREEILRAAILCKHCGRDL